MTTYGGAAIHVEKVGDGVLIEIKMRVDGMTRVIHFPNSEEAMRFGAEVCRVAAMDASEFDRPDAVARCEDDRPDNDFDAARDWPMP